MATTDYGVNHPLAVKLWARKLYEEALKQTYIYKFTGKDDNALVQVHEDTQKGPGDKVTVGLRMQLTSAGVQGDGTLEGSEESLVTYSDSLVINQLRNAVRSAGRISEQRVPFELRGQCMSALRDWLADRLDTSFFNQITGNSAQSDTRYTGNNTATAPSSNNRYYANGVAADANVASASASNAMQLKFIDYAVEKAKTNSPSIRPIMYEGNEYYVCFLHPYQVTAMRQATAAGSWLDLQKAALAGYSGRRETESNPIFNGALGMYNNVLLFESTRIPLVSALGASATNGAYRAVLCGAQAASIAFGRETPDMKAIWNEQKFDYGNQFGVAGGLIYGLKKSIFNSQDFGVVTISTYGAAS